MNAQERADLRSLLMLLQSLFDEEAHERATRRKLLNKEAAKRRRDAAKVAASTHPR